MSVNRERLDHCLRQTEDAGLDVTERISAANIARQYLEGLTRELVDEARDEGHSWDALATVFATTPENLKARFGSYRDYGDD